ncbi:ATP-dependent metallopeptidase FtsH/Yme1/Tma family protein [Clostridium beijerinckii]|uniref:ATP-dependent metallopeptidase FtsH/Yme1/Tma family protein n=1 Tax=Clostridium beijerinckii TaxID=1520 RepID=UPI000AB01575|nr:ATP-dependent metallopeptidase FtsH/Yme1/Tma family protein [Clostridium beijerinckii]
MIDKKTVKIISVVFAILLLLSVAYNFHKKVTMEKEISYNEFINLLDKNEISQVVISQENIKIIPKNNSEYKNKILFTVNINDGKLVSKLQDLHVSYSIVEKAKENPYLIIFLIFIALAIFIYIAHATKFLKHKNK